MKKIISILLCAVIIFSALSVCVNAEKDETPVIFVPGFLQSYMYIEGENGEEDEYIWLFEKEKIFSLIGSDLENFIPSLLGLTMGQAGQFGELLGKGLVDLLYKLECNPDGSSIYPITHAANDPAQANVAALKQTVSREGERKQILFEKFADFSVANGYTDPENIFIFEYDSRLDAITIANELREYIKAVKEYTGSDKVSLFTISYGGLITASYFYYYADEGDIEKAVINVPPLLGTNFPYILLTKQADMPLGAMCDFVESILGSDTELSDLILALETGKIDAMVNGVSDGLFTIFHYWGSLFSMISTDCYEQTKEILLDPVESASIIEKSDIIHYEIMADMDNLLDKTAASGTDISITVCSGGEMVFGGDLDGDLLVPTYSASGAEVCRVGKRFADGYTGLKTACDNPEHNHISPAMEIDASCAFLPEKTWFIDGSHHAQFELEGYASSLYAKLLFTDELPDVHADKNYPQFGYSDNVRRHLRASFNSSRIGYISAEDSTLVLTNVMGNSTAHILSVTANGLDITFDLSGITSLAPGETVEIPFSGEIPQVSATRAEITVNYMRSGTISEFSTHTIPVTINNGPAPEYNGGTDEVSFTAPAEEVLPEFLWDIIEKFALERFFCCIFNTLSVLIG